MPLRIQAGANTKAFNDESVLFKSSMPQCEENEETRASRKNNVRAPFRSAEPSRKQKMVKSALAESRLNRLAAGKKSVFDTNMSDIGQLGIGILLYFMLSKYLSITYLVMGILSLPSIIVNYYGRGISTSTVDPLGLAYVSLGNQGINEDTRNDTSLCQPKGSIDCTGATVYAVFTSNPYTVTWIITLTDCIYSFVFILFCWYYHYKVSRAITVHLYEHLTPAKYSVHVRGLPSDATELEIKQHFDERYDLTKPETTRRLYFKSCWGRRHTVKKHEETAPSNASVVTNVDHLVHLTSQSPQMYMNSWIAEVAIARNTNGLLRLLLTMQSITKKIEEASRVRRILIRETSTFAKDKKTQKKRRQAEHQLIRINLTLRKLQKDLEKRTKYMQALSDSSLSRTERVRPLLRQNSVISAFKKRAARPRFVDLEACICAFVMFNNIESKRRCLHDYRYSKWYIPNRLQPKDLRFRGQFALQVDQAPEPSNILWENLETSDRERLYRRVASFIITFFLLLASFTIISFAQSTQTAFKSKIPPKGFCTHSLPMVYYGSANYSIRTWNLELNMNATCPVAEDGTPRYHIAFKNNVINPLPTVMNQAPGDVAPVRCVEPCISEANMTLCSTLSCFDESLQAQGEICTTYPANYIIHCMCISTLMQSIKDTGWLKGSKSLWEHYVPCRETIKGYIIKNALILSAAIVVVMVNMLLKVLLLALEIFERHSSESSKASATIFRTFCAQFFNTAVIIVVLNASLNVPNIPLLKTVFHGKFSDFEQDWYPTVGMSITTSMIINAIAPHISLLVQMFITEPCFRVWQRRRIESQDQMNSLYAGPSFDISVRYPLILNSLFVTMIFCGGSPILLFIASFTATITFWLDKLSLIHLFSVKTSYDESIGQVIGNLLPWTLVLHLAFSIWMYGNNSLLKSPQWDLNAILQSLQLYGFVEKSVWYPRMKQMFAVKKDSFLSKLSRSNTILLFCVFVMVVLAIVFTNVWSRTVAPIIRRLVSTVSGYIWRQTRVVPVHSESNGKNTSMPAPPYTDIFRKQVPSDFFPDTKLGFKISSANELIRLWQEDTTRYGISRRAGECMRTYEAIQVPLNVYAIEANEKYRSAVAQIKGIKANLRNGE